MIGRHYFLTWRFFLAIGYGGKLWIKVKARLDLETRFALMFQKHILL